jgi:hypothetical protein
MLQQITAAAAQADQDARARNQAVISSILAQQQAANNVDLARSLVTPQVQINPLDNASAVPQTISADPATFGGATPLVQSLAPTPQVQSLTPALARNEQNNLDTARTEQQLSEQEMARLINLRERAADAYRQRIRQILTEPRQQ